MATKITNPPQVPQNQDQHVDAQKKRTRPNPARRRAAKGKAENATQESQVSTSAVSGNEQSQIQPKKSTIKTSESNTTNPNLKATPATPTTLTRQKTEPLSPTPRKPNLARTKTSPSPTTSTKVPLPLTAPALITGGLVGCAASAAILLGVGIWHDFSGAESALLTAKAAKLCVDNFAEDLIASLRAGTYSADEALDMLRRTTLAYASTIPEGAGFVERVFREIGIVRKQRGREVDRVVAETYALLQREAGRGATAAEMREVVLGQVVKLSGFASRATRDVVARNPGWSPFRDGAARALQEPPESKGATVRVNMMVRQK